MLGIDYRGMTVRMGRTWNRTRYTSRLNTRALDVLMRMRDEARGTERYDLVKKQLIMACYGAPLRTLRKMTLDAKKGG